ncbi:MAG TPA: GNAT family N-acetyltransferase [Clostridia bacterium]|nr:GNAT family N-acetyltransferase [Clostridia bacterium]
MELVRGEKTYIKKLEREHVNLMQRWGRHEDPLFYCYNFPHMSEERKDCWYRNKTLRFSKKCFVVFNNYDQLVGYIALRNIKILKKTSELGIVFDPNNINQGYGTDGLKAFLDYYFRTLKMKALYLKVSIFNKRAQRCYEKAGFRMADVVTEEFEDQSLPIFEDDCFIPYRHFFQLENKKLKCRFLNMFITREMHYER